jgi:hypothetical protein
MQQYTGKQVLVRTSNENAFFIGYIIRLDQINELTFTVLITV